MSSLYQITKNLYVFRNFSVLELFLLMSRDILLKIDQFIFEVFHNAVFDSLSIVRFLLGSFGLKNLVVAVDHLRN